MLDARGGVVDCTVVDLYAGSGSFGLESLSRGATHVTFVERNRTAAKTLQENIDLLGFTDNATVLVASATSAAAGLDRMDLAFCDPPYADNPWPELLDVIDANVLVGHAESPIRLVERWEEVRRRTYGRSHILIARQRFRPSR